jgi:hypothetical protein
MVSGRAGHEYERKNERKNTALMHLAAFYNTIPWFISMHSDMYKDPLTEVYQVADSLAEASQFRRESTIRENS